MNRKKVKQKNSWKSLKNAYKTKNPEKSDTKNSHKNNIKMKIISRSILIINGTVFGLAKTSQNKSKFCIR